MWNAVHKTRTSRSTTHRWMVSPAWRARAEGRARPALLSSLGVFGYKEFSSSSQMKRMKMPYQSLKGD